MEEKSDTAVARPPVETLIFHAEPQSVYGVTLQELWSFLSELISSPHARRIGALAAVLLTVLVINMFGQILLNRWQGDFFRAIERHDWLHIRQKLLQFIPLLLMLLAVVVSQTFFHERLKIRIREWLSHALLDRWLVPGRAYRLNISSDAAVNPDQRIQEDVRNFSEMSTDLGIGLVQASLLLIVFVGVLWTMSSNIYLSLGDQRVHVPGYMVWVALLYAGFGSWVTARVGHPLVTINEKRYMHEANFRFSLVHFSESSESIAFYSGEADERTRMNQYLEHVLNMMRQLSVALAWLTFVTSGYGWLMIVLPVVVALPGYLQGALDLGGLMMVVGAFGQVQQALRWFVDNFAKIADWRAAMHRVYVFRYAVDLIDQYEEGSEQIQLVPHPEGHLSFENLKISLVDGEVVIADASAHIYPGERVMIVGESGSGKSTLFRAIRGLWPWGSGVIRLPDLAKTMFLPQKPYMPLGTLAEALAYGKGPREFNRDKMRAALLRVNLPEFISQLDQTERWDKLMSLGQQQRFAFARLLYHRPEWVFLDEATSALDEENQQRVMSLLIEDLVGITVLSISHRRDLERFYTRALQLVSTQGGTVLRRRRRTSDSTAMWKRIVHKFT